MEDRISRDRLRICMVALMYAPIVGGAEVRAQKYARQLVSFGHKVTIVTLRHGKDWKRQETCDGIDIIRVGGIYKNNGTLRIGRMGHFPPDMQVFQELWRIRHDVDLFYCLQISTLAAVTALVGKLAHKPVVISIPSTGPAKITQPEDAVLMADTLVNADYLKIPFHDTLAGDITNFYKTAVGGRAMLSYLKQSDAYYQVLSSRSRDYLISNGFKADRIVPISGSVDAQMFHPDAALQPDPAKPERDIICVARLEFPKGIDVLLHAWYRMMREPANWRQNLKPRLLIVGDGTLKEQIHRIAKDLQLDDSVTFLGLHRDVTRLLQQSWGFVLPSRWEGMPNALLEAMACGLPCVATRVSGSEDIITDGVNGLLVPSEQPADMAQALRRIIEDTELARKLGQEARQTILREYQLQHMTEQTLQFYYYLLKKKTEAPSSALGRLIK